MRGMLRVAALTCAATIAIQATGATGHVAAQAAQDTLAPLETALQAQPDDIKAANDYRMAVIKASQYDRAIAFFEKLTKANPQAANAHLNYGFAYVDKIPAAGAITQVILANNALGEFTKSLDLKKSWIGYYTRGNSYLFWPRIFGRTQMGIDDLNEALKIQLAEPKRAIHARVYVALGDGYWKIDNLAEATRFWKEGLAAFPDHAGLKARLATQGDALQKLIESNYDPAKRVDTSLADLWSTQ
jgi:tetratricopeptide (TPR) repeat protein